jgi:hypothetical protein
MPKFGVIPNLFTFNLLDAVISVCDYFTISKKGDERLGGEESQDNKNKENISQKELLA